MRFWLISCLALAACGTKDSDTASGDNGGDNGGNGGDNGGSGCSGMDCYVNVTTPYVGDTTCFDGSNWGLGQAVDPSFDGQTTSITGTVNDFQNDEPVEGGSVRFWFNNDINGTPDLDVESDSSGNYTATLPVCAPLAYETYTPVKWEQTVNTYEINQIYSPTDTDDNWNSVSVATSNLIPTLLGLTWNSGTAIVAGTAYDCNENGIQNAQVYIHDANGNPPADVQIRYFANGLPNSDQPYTNDDGLWSAVNVPVGQWIVEMWGFDGTQLVLLGSTSLDIQADSVNISNIYTGIDDGIYYPASCLSGA